MHNYYFVLNVFLLVDPAKMEFVESESQYFYREGYKSGVSRYAIPLDLQDNRTLVIASNTVGGILTLPC